MLVVIVYVTGMNEAGFAIFPHMPEYWKSFFAMNSSEFPWATKTPKLHICKFLSHVTNWSGFLHDISKLLDKAKYY